MTMVWLRSSSRALPPKKGNRALGDLVWPVAVLLDKRTSRDTEGAGIWGDSLGDISHIKLSQDASKGESSTVSNWFPLYPCELVSLIRVLRIT